jgi:hypothetical protein
MVGIGLCLTLVFELVVVISPAEHAACLSNLQWPDHDCPTQ